MRITLVTETFPPEVNGAAGTLHRLVAGLAARGHRLVVARPRSPREGEEAATACGWEQWPVASVLTASFDPRLDRPAQRLLLPPAPGAVAIVEAVYLQQPLVPDALTAGPAIACAQPAAKPLESVSGRW